MGASPDQEVVELDELYKMMVRAYVFMLPFQSYSSFLYRFRGASGRRSAPEMSVGPDLKGGYLSRQVSCGHETYGGG